MKIILTGGGTGGHVVPFVPIIESIRTLFTEKKSELPSYLEPKELDMQFVGVVTDEAKALFAEYDIPTTHIPSGKLRRYVSALNITDIVFRIPVGIMRALFTVWSIMPDVVVSKGGYGSLPVVFASWVYRIPVLLHETDSIPGASNRLLARFASGIALGYASSAEYFGKQKSRTVVTGNPVRGILRQKKQADAKKAFNIPAEEFTLLVTGGSQGAKQINEQLLGILPSIITDTTIIHVTGPKNFQAVSTVAQELIAQSPRKQFYKPYPYLTDTMVDAIVASDAVITRAGGSLFELAAARKPALIIPLDGAANDHQRKNAQSFEAAGAALVLDPTNMGRSLFTENVKRLRYDEDLRKTLAQNIATLDFPGSARNIASLILYLAQGLQPRNE